MKSSFFRATACAAILFSFTVGVAQAQTQLANPGFEGDAANVGNPGGWNVHKDAKVTAANGNSSAGRRALLVTGGYMAVEQNLKMPLLASQRLSFSIDAKGESSNAVFGVRIGWLDDDGKWRDTALLWNKKLTSEYQTADLILALQARPTAPQIAAVLQAAGKLHSGGGKLAPEVTTAALEKLSHQLREVYLK